MVATWKRGQAMARPKKTEAPDLAQACELTAGNIDRLTCPAGKGQGFLRDTKAPGLRVRVTAAGAKSYVFEGKLNRQTIRRTMRQSGPCDVAIWSRRRKKERRFELRNPGPMGLLIPGSSLFRGVSQHLELEPCSHRDGSFCDICISADAIRRNGARSADIPSPSRGGCLERVTFPDQG